MRPRAHRRASSKSVSDRSRQRYKPSDNEPPPELFELASAEPCADAPPLAQTEPEEPADETAPAAVCWALEARLLTAPATCDAVLAAPLKLPASVALTEPPPLADPPLHEEAELPEAKAETVINTSRAADAIATFGKVCMMITSVIQDHEQAIVEIAGYLSEVSRASVARFPLTSSFQPS